MERSFRGLLQQSDQAAETIATKRGIACDEVEISGHNPARRIIQQAIRDDDVGISQQWILSPAWRQRRVNVSSKKASGW